MQAQDSQDLPNDDGEQQEDEFEDQQTEEHLQDYDGYNNAGDDSQMQYNQDQPGNDEYGEEMQQEGEMEDDDDMMRAPRDNAILEMINNIE